MPEKTAAQKKAQKAYMEKFVRVEIRMAPEQRAIVQAHAENHGESVNGFIGRAISETMERDGNGISPTRPQEARGQPTGSLPFATLQTAQEAAQIAGESVPQFIERAIETQAKRDKVARKMGDAHGNQ